MKLFGILSGVLLVAFVSTSQAERHGDKCLVEIFIESFCKFSKRFIVENFCPAYNNVKNQIEVEFYPYGKAIRTRNDDDEIEIQCQHGEIECVNNTKQSCALDLIGDDQDRQVDFICCSMADKTLKHCTDLLNLDKKKIEECAAGERGDVLQRSAADETDNVMPQANQVPVVVFNGIYTEDNSMSALHNFTEAVERICNESPKDGEQNPV